ncbi:MAG TPA: Rieske (2Fe-2S) protein [Rudaea sp.]|jgi:nitrite reductase/ring-hydroxylating ferredoxin subunit|uniref:Rieske (2Fe-2S) protein n=1 Tax=Rudaea sp. TaxID=2136325 RepID=UPI002F946F59
MSVRKTLCRLADIPDGGAIALDLPAESANAAEAYADSLILLRQAAQVFAYRNVCPHAGRRLDWAPGRFLIENSHLICASHGAVFAIASGLCVDGPCRGESLAALPIEIVGDEVHLAQL